MTRDVVGIRAMKQPTAAIVLAAVLALASPASATVIDGPPKFQRWADRAKVPTPDLTVTVTKGPECGPDAMGCVRGDRVVVNPDMIRRWGFTQRFVFLHELGHLYDHHYLTDADRASFVALIRAPVAGWWDEYGASGYEVPGEVFADTYAELNRRHVRPGNGELPSTRRALRAKAQVLALIR